MADDNLRPPPSSSARPIAASPHRRSDSHASQSPSRASATARLATPVQDSPISSGLPAARPQYGESQPDRTPLAGSSGGSYPGPGTSSLSQALQSSYAQQQQGFGTSPTRESESTRLITPVGTPRGGYGSFHERSYSGQPGQSPSRNEDIGVLRRHLAGPQQTEAQAGSLPSSYRRQDDFGGRVEAEESDFSSLRLQGGDTTRHIYRYAEKRERQQAEEQDRGTGKQKRSMSVTLPAQDGDAESIRGIQVPGGFRREHIRRTEASPAPSSIQQRKPHGTTERSRIEPARQPRFAASNFIEFLTIYGHFAGEELDEDDEALGPDEYFSSDAFDEATTDAEDDHSDDGEGWGEDSALLTPAKKKRRRRERKRRDKGKSTPLGATLLLLKSFVGTGVLFLPRAFYNGGMLFSVAVLVCLAGLSYYCFILLVGTRMKVASRISYGDMGGQIFGPTFRNLINTSLVISQIGFASAYIVFVSENIQAFLLAVSRCSVAVQIKWFILLQLLIFLPISLYRNINNIQKMALVADLFIVIGLLYLTFYDIKTIIERPGVADITQFNPSSWTLLIGTAIFTFEGVGLIIPIQSSMKEPEKFPRVLATVIGIIGVLFIGMGALSYAAYGSNTKTVILLNLPQDDKMVNGVQFLYSLAILLSIPLQIFPAIEITSQQLFSKTGKYNPWIKWQKNCFRFFMTGICAAVAWMGSDDLDKFVSIVGSFACIPLVYIYPPSMHFRAASTRLWERVVDVFLVVFGFCMMTYTTALTVDSWMHGGRVHTPGYCDRR